MKKLLILLPFLLLCSCKELVPPVISIESILSPTLQIFLEAAIENQACEHIEAAGYECNIPEQVQSITFTWRHDPENTVDYELLFCLKADCPLQ